MFKHFKYFNLFLSTNQPFSSRTKFPKPDAGHPAARKPRAVVGKVNAASQVRHTYRLRVHTDGPFLVVGGVSPFVWEKICLSQIGSFCPIFVVFLNESLITELTYIFHGISMESSIFSLGGHCSLKYHLGQLVQFINMDLPEITEHFQLTYFQKLPILSCLVRS